VFAEIRIYYEGDESLQSGFSAFFASLKRRAKDRAIGFRLIAAGAGSVACRDFGIALRTHPNAWNILLKDSEGPYSIGLSTSLCEKHKWDKSHADSIFWMVEMMESWFHADKKALEEFYGKEKFHKNSLKGNPKVEEIPKADLEDGLRKATKRAGNKPTTRLLTGQSCWP
jgi:hypothetical protein